MKKDIGIVRAYSQKSLMVNCLMEACHALGLDACTYCLTDVDMHSGTVPAQWWDGTQYHDCITEIPSISECLFLPDSPWLKAHLGTELLQWLGEHTLYTDGASLSKELLSQCLMMSSLSAYAIPTYRVISLDDIERYVSMFNRCIIKPSSGRQGISVIAVERLPEGLIYSDGGDWRALTPAFWTDYLAQLRGSLGRPLLQPRLNFSLDDAHAMDIRILAAKGGSGDWEIVKIYPRIGVNAVVSNISHGGEIGTLEEVLQQIAGANADAIRQELERLGWEIPRLVAARKPGRHSCFGIDIGIDRDTMQLYVIECNTLPQTKIYSRELARVKAEYLAYLLKRHASAGA